MSNWYEAVAVCDVEESESAAVAEAAISRMIAEGIIQSEFDPESVLGGDGGYRPGPNVEMLYRLADNERPFWSLRTNGVEVCSGPWVNQLGFTCFDGFTCPVCAVRFPPDSHAVADSFAEAIGSFLNNGDDLEVVCPSCSASTAASDWKTDPHFGFTKLAFQFWNWPPLHYDSWNVDTPALIASVTRHKVIVTYGRL